jgi:hypothetical protein
VRADSSVVHACAFMYRIFSIIGHFKIYNASFVLNGTV